MAKKHLGRLVLDYFVGTREDLIDNRVSGNRMPHFAGQTLYRGELATLVATGAAALTGHPEALVLAPLGVDGAIRGIRKAREMVIVDGYEMPGIIGSVREYLQK